MTCIRRRFFAIVVVMKTFLIQTLGCKVNQYESRQIHQVLEQAGLKPARPGSGADIIVVNTCCVTHIASAKSRQAISREYGKNPDALLIITGCLPVGQDNELNSWAEKCLIVKEKETLPEILKKILSDRNCNDRINISNKPLNTCKIKDKTENTAQIIPVMASETAAGKTLDRNMSTLPILTSYAGQTRAFLKVQDGCDAYCTYCIIPKIRTRVCNKDVKTVLLEAQNLITAGHKEIVLTGIFLGAYGQTTAKRKRSDPALRNSLAELVQQVAVLPGLARLRLSSLEPADVTDRLLEVFKTQPTLAPHLHLSLQSGSARILRRMARQYTIEHFMDIIGRIMATLDRPAITTDIIVGFPGETDDDFEQTMEIARRVGFAKIHVFSFSARKNTPAAKMEPKIPPAIIHQRSERLQALDKELQAQFRRQFIGRQVEVLVENTRPPKGRCERYFMVNLSEYAGASKFRKGQIVRLTLTQ